MRWHYISKTIGVLLIFLCFAMTLPLVLSFHYNDGQLIPIVESIAITMISGFSLIFLGRKSEIDFLSQREGIAIVALGWTAMGLFGAFPFFLGDTFLSFTDAFFESVSGFTTTGSSVMTNIEAAPLSILMWRSFIQWLGGMGIIVLTLAILPFLG
ncbi:MAG: TrkH family potassium uptake protein, partial [Desulfobacteraceae bacterium]|nr:TrkH family potassium uptake protein [Desulfobacteraceae bacterium]